MKNQIIKFSLGALAMISVSGIASAHQVGVLVDTGVDVNVSGSAKVETIGAKAGASVKATTSVKTETGNATSSSAKAKNDDKSSSGAEVGAEHRTAIATFVLKLNSVADRDGGIGPEVRAVAKEQASTSEKIAINVEKVQKRSKFMIFLFGSDFKTMGELRSEMVVTENSISRLTKAKDRAVSASVRADLEAQIKVLETEEAKIDAFVDAHAETKGVIGWLYK
jgi:hypothetical protein